MPTPPLTFWLKKALLEMPFAAALFVGVFWLILTYLQVLTAGLGWWPAVRGVLPGAALVILALLARKHPVPYGSAYLAIGLLPWLFGQDAGLWQKKMVFSLPILAAGAALIAQGTWFRHPAKPRE